jgi:HK97 family phage major capsid protein
MPATAREEFTALATTVQSTIDAAKRERRDLRPTERQANENRFNRMAQLRPKLVADRQQVTRMAAEVYCRETGRPVPPVMTPEIVQFNRSREAFANYLRTGEPTHQEYTLTTTSGGGVLVPTSVAPPIVIRRTANPILPALALYGLDAMRTDNSDSVRVPVLDDTANTATAIAQDATTDNAADPDVSAGLLLGANLYDTGTAWVSNTMLRATPGYDLIAYLTPMLYDRLDKTQGAAWMAAMVAGPGNTYTTASSTAVTYTDVNNFYFTLPTPYRDDGVFFVSDGFLQAITNLLDSQGRPLYRQSMRDGVPDTLLGKPLFVSTAPALQSPAAAATVAVFASAGSLAIRLVNNQRLVRYADVPTKPDQTGLRVFQSGDFGFLPAGVAVLKFHA